MQNNIFFSLVRNVYYIHENFEHKIKEFFLLKKYISMKNMYGIFFKLYLYIYI